MIARITMFAAVMTLGSAVAAREPHPQAVAQVAVPYGDLDLTTAHGRKLLDSRLHVAAEALCPVDPTVYASVQFSSTRACIAKVRAGVAQRVAEITTAAGVTGKSPPEVAAR